MHRIIIARAPKRSQAAQERDRPRGIRERETEVLARQFRDDGEAAIRRISRVGPFF